MFVYGFSAKNVSQRISKDIVAFVSSKKNSINLTKIRTIFSVPSLHLLNKTTDMAENTNGLFPEPYGAKGIVESVDLENKTITLKNARYYIETTNEIYTSDLKVYVDGMTYFTKDLELEGSLASISPNDVIICNGPINFTDKSIKYAYEIYQGRFIVPDAKTSFNFSAPIFNFDPVGKTFEFNYPCSGPYPGEAHMLIIKVSINAETRIFTVSKDSQTLPSEFKLGEIPAFVKTGSIMNGVFIVNQDLTAVANTLYFFEQ